MITYNEISNLITSEGFEGAALKVFRFQVGRLPIYKRYVELLGINPERVTSLSDVPYLPIEFFRREKIYSAENEPQLIFNSSGTSGGETSTHYVASSQLYIDSFMAGFKEFFGAPEEYRLVTMLPSYREGSSLLYMIEELKRQCTGEKIILWGVTFALLEEALSGKDVTLPPNSIVLETGGMKGRGKEIERRELHKILCNAYGVKSIASEYGMCELLSQGYSSTGGIFTPSSTMRVVGRQITNPLKPSTIGEECGINIIDLSNYYSCSFLATGDRGTIRPDGSFEIHGRLSGEILRGCNMLIND